MTDEPQIHVDTDKARGGETPGVMRYVLGVSLMLTVVLMVVVWLTMRH